jgi:hypothetical protein
MKFDIKILPLLLLGGLRLAQANEEDGCEVYDSLGGRCLTHARKLETCAEAEAVKLLGKIGETHYIDETPPVQVVSLDSTSVSFQIKQTIVPDTLGYLYTAFDEPMSDYWKEVCYEVLNVLEDELVEEVYTAHCLQNTMNPFAIVRVYASDTKLPDSDNALIPRCCFCSEGQEGNNVVEYTFEVQCAEPVVEADCEEEEIPEIPVFVFDTNVIENSTICHREPAPIVVVAETVATYAEATCQNFAVHARTKVTFAGITSTMGGDISGGTGVTGTPIFVDGEEKPYTTDFAAFVTAAHAAAMAVRADGKAITNEIGGVTFTPGTYRSGSSLNFAAGVVTLDAEGDENAVFLFQAPASTLVTAASTSVVLKNGAQAGNVIWALGTAATLGANSVLVGSILAGSAITVGSQAEIRGGCALAQTAVTFSNEGYVTDVTGEASVTTVTDAINVITYVDGNGNVCDCEPAASVVSLAQKVCQNFAIHARATITFAGLTSTVHGGDIGVSPGTSITGSPILENGEKVYDSGVFAASVKAAHAAAMEVRADGKHMEIEMGGVTFTPGTYRSGSAINLAHGQVVTLDGLNQPNPVFLFQATASTLITAADTSFVLKNGAKAENVMWALGTSATLGANSVLEGSILAGAAITVLTGAEIHGCALAQTAVTFASGGSVAVISEEYDDFCFDTDIAALEDAVCVITTAPVCQNFAVHAGSAVTFAGVTTGSTVGGDVGGITGVTGIPTFTSGGSIVGNTVDFAASMVEAHTAAMVARVDGKTMAIEIGGLTFTPGTYRSGSAINFAHGTVVTLDGGGDENAKFLFQAGSAMTTAADTSFILQNGAKAENVIWALGTAATLGARSILEGSILAGSAITIGTEAEVRGCALAKTAVTFETNGHVTGTDGHVTGSSTEFTNAVQGIECTFESSLEELAQTECETKTFDVCRNYGVHAQATITFDGVTSHVQGDVGVSPGTSITGSYVLENGSIVDSGNADFATSVVINHAKAMSAKGQAMEIEMGGVTFTPGTYRSGSAINFALGTVVTLDAEGDENATFLFIAGSTLVTAANTYFNMINGAKAENVIWALGTSATLGADSVLVGSIMAGAAITFLTGAELRDGCALAQTAVTFASNGHVTFEGGEPNLMSFTDCSTKALANGVCQDFALHARTTITFDGVMSIVKSGDIGVSPGTSITGSYNLENGSVVSGSDLFAVSVLVAHAAAITVRADGKHMEIEMGGVTFTPGTYRSGSAINFALGTVVTLDAEGDENATFLFQAGSTLVTAADTYFNMINGAKAENVIWALGTAATLGANSVLEGSIIAGTAITFLTGAELRGCGLARSAITFASNGHVSFVSGDEAERVLAVSSDRALLQARGAK